MYQASAPGKIILFGEHAAVYHRPAIAVPVHQVQATATLQPNEVELRIIASDLGQDYLLRETAADNPIAAIIQATLAL